LGLGTGHRGRTPPGLANEYNATVGSTFPSLDAPVALAITAEQLRLHGNPDVQAESER